MEVVCSHCGRAFEAKRSTAKYCSATCRQRARRDRKAAEESVEADADAGRVEHQLVRSVRQDLEAADAVDTFNGQLALQLARRLANPDESGISALSKELRTVMAAALAALAGKSPEPEPDGDDTAADEGDDVPDEVTAARRKRDAAREAAGRA